MNCLYEEVELNDVVSYIFLTVLFIVFVVLGNSWMGFKINFNIISKATQSTIICPLFYVK